MQVAEISDFQEFTNRLPDQRELGRVYLYPPPDAEWADTFNRYAARHGKHAPVIYRGADCVEIMATSDVPGAVLTVHGLVKAVNAELH